MASADKAALSITIREEFASAQSTQAVPGSSFTACVYDVMVGKVDLCLSDFWVTAERMGLAAFVSPFEQDLFYVLVPDDTLPETFTDMLAKPFLPFAWNLWGLVVGFLLFSGFVNMLADNKNQDDFENPSKFARVFKSIFLSFGGYFAGGSVNNPSSAPARVAQLGYGFFILIILASYTANLATILVAKSSKRGINSIQDAIDQGVTICVLKALEQQATSLFPQAKWHLVSGSDGQVRDLNLGKCGATLIHEQRITKAQSGMDVIADCASVESGKLKPEEAVCVKDISGNPDLKRDCKFKTVYLSIYLSICL
jgi:hypothetical protein